MHPANRDTTPGSMVPTSKRNLEISESQTVSIEMKKNCTGVLMAETDESFQAELTALKRKIPRILHADRDIATIVEAGEDRDALLQLLALAVMPAPLSAASDLMRGRQEALRSMARRMRTLADEAEAIAFDPVNDVKLWAAIWSRDPEGVVATLAKPKEGSLLRLFEGMRHHARNAENRANAIGMYLRKNAPIERRLGVVLLLQHVHQRTGKVCENELARLLMDATEAAGHKKTFSADKLRKTFQRYVQPHLRHMPGEQPGMYGLGSDKPAS